MVIIPPLQAMLVWMIESAVLTDSVSTGGNLFFTDIWQLLTGISIRSQRSFTSTWASSRSLIQDQKPDPFP